MSVTKLLALCLGLSLLLNIFLLQQPSSKNDASLPLIELSSTQLSTPTISSAPIDADSLLEQLIQHQLSARDCVAAANHLIYKESDTAPIDILHQWKQLVATSIQQHDFELASTCLSAILDLYPYNPTFNWQLGELHWAQQDYEDALTLFYQALPMSTNDTWVSQQRTALNTLIMQYFQKLHEQSRWKNIQQFFSQVISLDDTNVHYQLIFAESLFQLQQFNESKIWLVPLTTDPQVGIRAQQLLAKIESRNTPKLAIPLQRIGEQYLVSVFVDNHPITLLIDTGASISLLTESKYQQMLNATTPIFIRDTSLQTAGGTLNAPVYQYEKIEIAGITREKPHFVVVELEQMRQFDGLLGMDFFKSYHFIIDQQNNQLLLSPIEATLAEAE